MLEDLNIPNNNLEIDQSLKEFESKSQAEQISQAPEVSKDSDIPKMVQLVMKWFGLKDQRQAEYVLLEFVVIAIAVSLFLVLGGSRSSYQEKIILPVPTAGERFGDPNFKP